METQSGKQKAEIGLPTSSRQQKRPQVHLFRDSYTAKWPYIHTVCDDNFSIAHGGGNYVIVSRGIEQTVNTNSSVRQFCAALPKTADSKLVSVTRAEVMLCELIVERNIPLALLSC